MTVTQPLEPIAEPILIDELYRAPKMAEQFLVHPSGLLPFLVRALAIRKLLGKKHETVKKRMAALVEASFAFKEKLKLIELVRVSHASRS